jgi:predicted nucleotidyltransferase
MDIDADGSGISAVLLFGSRARGDNSRGSDTDLLLISPPGTPRHKSSGHLSMFFYPWIKLVADAREGDLFVCHLTLEAKAVFDPTDRLEKLRSAFKLRSNYQREIVQACEVGSLIDRFAEQLTPEIVARRILWCVRTILIARSAERGEPVFAPAQLAATASSAAAADLLVGRHQRKVDATMRQRFRRFLAEEANDLTTCACVNLDEYERWFERTGNMIGLQTLRSKPNTDGSYA